MSQTPDPAAQGQEAHKSAQPAQTLPWFRRPLFWGVLFFLSLFLLTAWLFWKEWQTAEKLKEQTAAQTAELQKQNQSRQGFIARLRLLLKEEPCEVLRQLPLLSPPAGVVWPPLAGNTGKPDGILPDASGATARPAPTTPQASQPAVAPQGFAALMEQATVLVLALRQEGLSMGSGFYVAPGYVVTNAHVVGAADKAAVVNKATGAPLSARVVQSVQSDGRDFAILAVDGGPAITPLALTNDVWRTERVSAWGFPGAVTNDDPQFTALLNGNATAAPEVVYTDGVVSVILERKPALIVHTATVSQGNSGGPLVNDNGEVVGINTFIKLDDESYRQSSLAIVSASLAEFLRSAGVPFTTAPPRASQEQPQPAGKPSDKAGAAKQDKADNKAQAAPDIVKGAQGGKP
ncbi:MAG: serine protease [Desulfovibrio sp.]|nr:serine protease [Desulfovibrio sp.]